MFEVLRFVYQDPVALGWVGGGGGDLPSPLMTFFNIYFYRHIHHTLTFQMSGETWPAPFYFVSVT